MNREQRKGIERGWAVEAQTPAANSLHTAQRRRSGTSPLPPQRDESEAGHVALQSNSHWENKCTALHDECPKLLRS